MSRVGSHSFRFWQTENQRGHYNPSITRQLQHHVRCYSRLRQCHGQATRECVRISCCPTACCTAALYIVTPPGLEKENAQGESDGYTKQPRLPRQGISDSALERQRKGLIDTRGA